MNAMLDQGQSVDKRVLRKAYEIFIHALNYDMETAWGCARCPRPLGQDEHELDFDGVIDEVYIADGINMGTQQLSRRLRLWNFLQKKKWIAQA